MQKAERWRWGGTEKTDKKRLLLALAETTYVRLPGKTKPFTVKAYVSGFPLRYVLLQDRDDKHPGLRHDAFASCLLSHMESVTAMLHKRDFRYSARTDEVRPTVKGVPLLVDTDRFDMPLAPRRTKWTFRELIV